jgi:hypothetical protein
MRIMTSVWDWFEDKSRDRKDGKTQELRDWFYKASRLVERDPEAALSALDSGKKLAEELDEKAWVLFFEHWRLQGLLHYKKNLNGLRELASRIATISRSDEFKNFPQRVCLHEDLVNAYMLSDSTGDHHIIEDALRFIETEAAPDIECRFCLISMRAEFDFERGKIDEAEQHARKLREMSENTERGRNHHYFASASATLCEIGFRKNDVRLIAEASREGELAARASNNLRDVATLTAWQAAVGKHPNAPYAFKLNANKRFQLATDTMRHVGSLPNDDYYDALAAYHEWSGDIDKAVKTREEQLGKLEGMGKLKRIAEAKIERCRLLKSQGALTPELLGDAREAANKLANPAAMLEKIEALD